MASPQDQQTKLKMSFQEGGTTGEFPSTSMSTTGRRTHLSESSMGVEDGLQKKRKYKVFNDPIHGNISIHPLCVQIIDTPQFQRLRFISQLGAVRYVYPGATHTRFEHSIGTCYLAGKWARKLRETLPQEYKGEVTDEDILCVMVAGLCHDMGHGPFSHMYENYYLGRIKSSPHFKHEEQSVNMFRYMILANQLEKRFEDYRLTSDSIEFIADMIAPSVHSEVYKKQPAGKKYLYQIVSNKSCGIDVDKWDYFARDCLHLNIRNSFDHKRLMEFSAALVFSESGDSQTATHSTEICFRDKEAENLYKMFELRYDLHRQAYQHKVTHIIHLMLADAMKEANGHLSITGEYWYYCDDDHPAVKREMGNHGLVCKKKHEAKHYKRMPASRAADCIDDPAVFTNLTDTLLSHIMQSQDTELENSQDIICRIHKRDLYTFFRTCPADHSYTQNEVTIKQDIARTSKVAIEEMGLVAIKEDDLFISVVKLDYSKEGKDPIDVVPFYNKHKPDVKINMLPGERRFRLVPAKFEQHLIYLTCRESHLCEKKKNALKKAFKNWCKNNSYTLDE